MKMSNSVFQKYWESSFKEFYQVFYQELVSEAMSLRWQRMDMPVAILVAVTACGSAVAGWSLWSSDFGRYIWVIIAGIASLSSIIHGVLQVPGKVKEQEKLRREFLNLRLDYDIFLRQINNLNEKEAETRSAKLLERFKKCMSETQKDVAFTPKLRTRVQAELNQRLEEMGYALRDK